MELIDIPPGRQARNHQLDMLRDDLDGVRGEISSLIGHIEGLREDLYGGDRGYRIKSICCCCRRRDLRKLEDRLWVRLHQLQEKENEIHRQRTAILSRLLLPDEVEEGKSPAPQQPPPVSPEMPESPPSSPWQQQQQQQQQRPPLHDRRQLASTSTAEDHAPPPRMVSDSSLFQPSIQAQQQQSIPVPVPPQRAQSLRRRPTRPGSAEDTGSGAE